jgi:phage terminase small subunit
MPKSSVEARHRIFVREYLVHQNATKAAAAAGYSEKCAHAQGHRLLKDPRIKAEIEANLKAREDRLEIKADDILRPLLEILRTDLTKLFDDNGDPIELHRLPPEVARAIASVDFEELYERHGQDRVEIGRTKKIRFWNKLDAATLLGKHLKLWVDRVEHDVSDQLAERLEAARKRVNGNS